MPIVLALLKRITDATRLAVSGSPSQQKREIARPARYMMRTNE